MVEKSRFAGGHGGVGPFSPERSAFAHAGRPEAQQASVRVKADRNVPLLVSRGQSASTMSAERILQGLRGTTVCISHQDADLVYSWIANPPKGFEHVAGLRDADILPEDRAAELSEAKRRCLETGEGSHLVIDLDGEAARWFDVWLEPDFIERDGKRGVAGVISVGIDITERVQREERLGVLLREVSHRARNLLSIVQSIASQTVRTVSAPGRFIERFNQRLQSLAHTLDLVTLREWEGATLQQLVSRQAGPFLPDAGTIEIGGVDPVLTPNAALHLGLAVQELASNAVSHGAWQVPGGGVEARTEIERDTGDLVFEWREKGEAAVGTLEPSGSFGSRTLMAVVPAALGGEASMVSGNEGFVYRLRVPPANFDA